MRKLILAGVASIALGGLAAGTASKLVWAQPAPPDAVAVEPGHPGGAPMPPPLPSPPPGMHGPWAMRGPHGPRGFGEGPLTGGPQAAALIFHPEDRQLTAPEVQKIAEAFLLWNGNRDWKVTQVVAGPNGKIGFAFATADGGVIARFTMDSKTGRVARVG